MIKIANYCIFTLVFVSLEALATNYYLNGTCSLNGDGSSASCATASGMPGAWKSLSDISGGPGDIINIKGGNYNNGTSWYNFPAKANGSPGNPLVVQNMAGEDVTIEGTTELSGNNWTAIGGGVYKCTGSNCAVADVSRSPSGIWYFRSGGTSEEVLNISMPSNCNSALPANHFVYQPGSLCVHLSDGSQPSSANLKYMKMPYYAQGIAFNGNSTHDVTIQRNPAGGSFAIQIYPVRSCCSNVLQQKPDI